MASLTDNLALIVGKRKRSGGRLAPAEDKPTIYGARGVGKFSGDSVGSPIESLAEIAGRKTFHTEEVEWVSSDGAMVFVGVPVKHTEFLTQDNNVIPVDLEP
jgi:hypothetical protein